MLSLQTVKNRQNFIAAALAAHSAAWFANHCAASVNSAEYQASVENALAEAEAAFDAPSVQEIDDIFAILNEPVAQAAKKKPTFDPETALDAYATTDREATERPRPRRHERAYRDLTPAQREAAALLHDQWRYLVHSVDGLNL